MSFFGRIKDRFIEKFVEDEFYQPLTEQEIYAVLQNKRQSKTISTSKRISQAQQSKIHNVIDVALSVSQHTPQIEFRLLGYQPSVQTISNKANALKDKLNVIDSHLLASYQTYLKNINNSLEFFSEGKEFYSTRKKAAELRFIIQKMNKVLYRSKVITRLNITIKNLKDTIKLIQKIPKIKKMNLIELKSIDLQRLQKTNQQICTIYHNKLLCLTNLSKYITKVNNQSFVFIINNLKMCLDCYDQQVYQQIMKSYLIIQPQTMLQKLLTSLVQERSRHIFDQSQGLETLGRHLIQLIINLHKIIKWHIINRAVRSKQRNNQSQTLSSNPSENQSIQPSRRLSITSDQSEEVIEIELNQIVYINIVNIKQTFNRSVDSCLTQLITDNILSTDVQHKQLYNYLQTISKISEICHNFTGLQFSKLRKSLIDYFNRKQSNLFVKYSRELVTSIQQQKNDWNRLAFPNNFKFAPIDKLLYRWTKINQIQQYKKIVSVINNFFSQDLSFLDDSSQSQEEQSFELNIKKMQSVQRLQKKYEQWHPTNYLQLYEGDVIVCQSTYKLLGILQKYTQLLIYTPTYKNIHTYYQHMLLLIQYQVYFIFNSLLTVKYKTLFFQQIASDMTLQKTYTLKRFKSLYPKITSFVNSFKTLLQSEPTNQSHRLIAHFKRQIKQIHNNQENQVLRAKVIATQSCKYCLAYFHQILKTYSQGQQDPSLKHLFAKVQDTRATISQLSTLLLTQSSQNLVSVQLQTIKSLFQSIRWYEAYQQLREYVHKIVSMVREAYQKLKSCNRGEIPFNTISFIFVFIWRTILTYSVKLFLENKNNNKRENKLNFQKFIDQLYSSFQNRYNTSLSGLGVAYNIFKSIFKILMSNNWLECKELLIETMKKYDYIYPILISLMENSEAFGSLSERQKQAKRLQFKEQIQLCLKQKK